MSRTSKEVGLDDAQPGMELARDLVDRHGTVLLQRGSILSASMLAALQRRGVGRLRVLSGAGDEGADLEAERGRIEARLAHLFRHQDGAPAARLRARLLAYRMETL